MPRLVVLAVSVLTALLAVPAAPAAAATCTGQPSDVQPITLTVEGEPATGIYTLPEGRPRGLVVFGHGAANTVDAWRRHLPAVSARDGVVAVAMNYRGMQVTGRSETRGTETARGWPAQAGGEDLVAAARHFDALCPGLPGIVLYGVSMGANMTGLAAAAAAERSDGRPLFDYWIAVEGAHNVTESYLEARGVAPAVPFAATTRDDIEEEMGGPLESRPATYFERTNVNRVGDIAAAGLRGAILVHAYEDGIVPYNQSVEMTHGLRSAGVPTDFYSVGRHGSGEPGTTIGSYAGVATGYAGHGWEGSQTHIVIQSGFDRLSALVTRGEPAPCNRDFRIDDRPSNIAPDPREAPAHCEPAAFPPPGGSDCDSARPPAPTLHVRRNGRRVRLRGRAAQRAGCARTRHVAVALARREGRGNCRFVSRNGSLGARRSCRRPVYRRVSGRTPWRLRPRGRLPRGRYAVRAVAVASDGARSKPARARFRLR